MRNRSLFNIAIFALLALVVALGSGAAFAAWIFPTSVSTSEEVDVNVDSVRENFIFGEEGEALANGTSRYDVYFFAQNGIDIDNLTNGVDASNSYYTRNGDEKKANPVFGQFSDETYYKVYNQVTALKQSQLPEPPSCLLFDGNSNPNNGTFYYLQFLCWSAVSYEGVYSNFRGSSYNGYYQVDGSYPTDETQCYPISFNTELSAYDGTRIIHTINGRNAICLFPIYTVGKSNNTGTNAESKADDISVEVSQDSVDVPSSFFTPDPVITDLLPSTGESNTRLYAYRMSGVIIHDSSSTFNIKIHPFISLGSGSETHNWGSRDNTGRTLSPSGGSIATQLGAGTYNLYLFVKACYAYSWGNVSTNFNSGNISSAASALSNSAIYPSSYIEFEAHSSISNSVWGVNRNKCARDYVLFEEKIFEPRILGGPSATFDYDAAESGNAKMVLVDGSDKYPVAYELRGVEMTTDFNMNIHTHKGTYNSNNDEFNVELHLPSNFFTIQMDEASSNQDIIRTIDCTTVDNADKPYIDYLIGTNTSREYYHSNHAGSDEGVKPLSEWLSEDHSDFLDGVYCSINGSRMSIRNALSYSWFSQYVSSTHIYGVLTTGTYNIALRCSQEQNGYTYSYGGLYIWVHRLHNIFIDIYDDISKIPSDESGFYDREQGGYAYSCTSAYYYLDTLESTDEFTSSGEHSVTNLSLGGIIESYESQGKVLYELVSGRILTSENLSTDKFVIRGNYILVAVDKSVINS